jgi:hypothetical protein
VDKAPPAGGAFFVAVFPDVSQVFRFLPLNFHAFFITREVKFRRLTGHANGSSQCKLALSFGR